MGEGGELSCNIPSRHKEEVEVQLYPHSPSTLEVVGWGTPRPSRFAVGKETWCTLYCTAGRVCFEAGVDGYAKISKPPGFEAQTVQPVDGRYTDCDITAPVTTAVS